MVSGLTEGAARAERSFMRRIQVAEGIIRVLLSPEDCHPFNPVSFRDSSGEYLSQTGCVFTPRPVFRLSVDGVQGEVRQTANGEVISFDSGECRQVGSVWSAVLRFSFPGSPVLTGLGAHEDGIFDYSGKSELLYEHNMKIPIPFLLSSDGWGLLLEAGCAMKFRGEDSGFTFELDAVEEISYLVIRGTDCADVLRRLAFVIGKPAMLPKWAFGYIQSKERYQSAEELLSVVREFRHRGLGLDCIVQDWMTWNDGCWGDKTPDPARFPDIRALTDALHQMNVHFMVSVWPNADKGRDCDEFAEAGFFLPSSRIYDAFSPEARNLYWQQCRRFWMDGGTDALWCDSCEPITDPDWCGDEKRAPETRFRLITEASALRMNPVTMNQYASFHLRGLREHWLRDIPSKRPVLLSRSGGTDSGALGAILWSGDISARWDILEKQVAEAVRVSCSGIPWWTLDIGGFFVDRKGPWFWRGDYPDGVRDPAYRELYIRWFQFGAMLPVFRSHGTDTPREPWAFGAEESPEYRCLREIIALRYRLLPYLYSTAARVCRDGLPMIRAMLTVFGNDPWLRGLSQQYMLGDALLVRPVTRSLRDGGDRTSVILPPGGWYDLFTEKYYEGGTEQLLETPLDRFPVLVRAGSVLPLSAGACSAAELNSPADELVVFAGADGCLDLYDDAGDGMEYLQDEYLRVPFHWDDSACRLLAGKADGSLPADFSVPVRLVRPDGSSEIRPFRYSGEPAVLEFR